MSLSRKFLLAAMVAAFAGAAYADPADYLKSQLAATPNAGKFVREFNAPDTLTGVVIELPGGQKMVSYLTPSGRYLISGVVIDLKTNVNLTQQYAAQFGGKPPPRPSVYSAQAVYQVGRMAKIELGNADSTSYIAVIFDPATKLGRQLMFGMMNAVSQYVKTPIFSAARFEFIPYGPDAAELLKGSNEQRLRNMLAYARGEKLPAPDAAAQQWAKTNTDIATHLKAKPPLMVLDIPSMKKARAVSFDGAQTPIDPQLAEMIGMIQGGR